MRRLKENRFSLLISLLLILAGLSAPANSLAQTVVADQLTEALTLYGELEFDKGIELAQSMLSRSDLSARDSVAILETLSIITYAKGEAYLKQAIGYLETISGIGPCVTRLPQDIWPKELKNNWYKLLKAKDQFTCSAESSGELKSIAIMEFDNYSIGEYQEKLGPIGKGLADFFEHDFAKISDLIVVERDKVEFILREIEMSAGGKVDAATAVKVGKLVGAQLMVFGSITQLDSKNTRMVVRVVKVETSEIVASVDEEGKPHYSKMEKSLVKKLAGLLDLKLNDKIKNAIDAGGTASMDATTHYSLGLEYMDKYDYKNAYANFKAAYELDNNFAEAKRKMDIYRPLAG